MPDSILDFTKAIDNEVFSLIDQDNTDLLFGPATQAGIQRFGAEISATDAPRFGAFIGGAQIANAGIQQARAQRYQRAREFQDTILARRGQALQENELAERIRNNTLTNQIQQDQNTTANRRITVDNENTDDLNRIRTSTEDRLLNNQNFTQGQVTNQNALANAQIARITQTANDVADAYIANGGDELTANIIRRTTNEGELLRYGAALGISSQNATQPQSVFNTPAATAPINPIDAATSAIANSRGTQAPRANTPAAAAAAISEQPLSVAPVNNGNAFVTPNSSVASLFTGGDANQVTRQIQLIDNEIQLWQNRVSPSGITQARADQEIEALNFQRQQLLGTVTRTRNLAGR